MIDKFKIEKIFIPAQGANTGSIVVKFAQDLETGKVFVGSGDDEWVIKNGIALDDLNKFKLEV